MTDGKSGASFRDPSGFIFLIDGKPYRQINRRYEQAFKHLHESGLYDQLVEKKLLIPHKTADVAAIAPEEAFAVIEPEFVPFISYPYEWCFEQLQQAALVTLRTQIVAMHHGMTLKDATAFNIQFVGGKAVHIDTLSFDIYKEGQPWMAYNQFCKHFLAPLVLMATHDLRLGRLSAQFLDGIPLDIASKLLPWKTRLNPTLFVHIHAHGKMAAKDGPSAESVGNVKKEGLLLMLQSLKSYVERLRPKGHSMWARYYDECTYTDADLVEKTKLVGEFIDAVPGELRTAWDLGANTGHFSRLATSRGIRTVALDGDPWAVSRCYQEAQKAGDELMLPLVQDLSNPSAAAGVRNQERESLVERAGADLMMALALIHHLTIGGNIPFDIVAGFFADIGKNAIVEFVPGSDPQSQRLMSFRKEVFDGYTQEAFEQAFSKVFDITDKKDVGASGRVLYLMRRKAS